MDINRIKDNEERNEEYVDAESFRDNFQGSEDELKIIAQTVYECVDATNENDETFTDECKSMLQWDYDYLSNAQYHEVLYTYIEELIMNDGEFKGE